MVPLPQSALRLQSAVPQNALNDSHLRGFRAKQVQSQEKTLSNGLLGIKNNKRKITSKLCQLRKYTCGGISAFAPSFTLSEIAACVR